LRKALQPLHARCKHPREGEGDQSTDEQHDEGGNELSLAKFDEREINLRKRQGQADYDRGISGLVIALGAIHQFVAESDAAVHGLACSAGQGILKLQPIRVVFHFVRVGFGIHEDAAGIVNDGYTRAAASSSAGPVAEFDGVSGEGRVGEGETKKGGELVVGGAYGLASDDARGVKLHREKDDEKQGAIGEAEPPEKPSSHGFRRGIQRRGLFS